MTGTNSAGSSSAGSSPTAVIAGAPANTAVPVGVWVGGAGEYVDGFGWGVGRFAGADVQLPVGGLRLGGGQCSPIAGATSSSYVLGASDVGSTVEVLVTGTNSAGSSSAGSSPTAVIAGAP